MNRELDLATLFYSLKKRILLLLLLTVIGGVAAGVITMQMIPSKYTAYTTIYVYNNVERQEVTISDINMSVKLVNTYILILKSNIALSKIASQSNLGYTAEQLNGMIGAVQMNDTELFKVNVTAFDPEHARLIAEAITDVLPAEILRVVKAGFVEIIDYPQQNPPRTSPNLIRNTVLGAAQGLLLAVALVLANLLMDKTIKNKNELSRAFDYPVLGAIPALKQSKRRTVDTY